VRTKRYLTFATLFCLPVFGMVVPSQAGRLQTQSSAQDKSKPPAQAQKPIHDTQTANSSGQQKTMPPDVRK